MGEFIDINEYQIRKENNFEMVTIKSEPGASSLHFPDNNDNKQKIIYSNSNLIDTNNGSLFAPVFVKDEMPFNENNANNSEVQASLEREFEELNPIDFNSETNSKDLNNAYPCDMCPSILLTFTELRLHKKAHYIERRTCHICNMVCQNLGKLKIHLNYHMGLRPYICDICEKTFSCKDQMRIHKRIHSGEKPYQCKKCNKTFRHLGSLRSHEVVHTELYKFKCKKCYKICSDENSLDEHMEFHKETEDQIFMCQLCKIEFPHNKSLQNHIKTHKELKYPCDYCQKIHETLFKLKRHIKRAHIPNVCEDCQAVFYDRAEYTKHRKTHKIEEPAVCSLCHKDFKKDKNLREHIRLQHTKDGKSHKCPLCDKEFINKSLLNNHIKTHDKCFKCPECDKVFSSRYNLETHSVVHSGARNHICPICGNGYSTKTSLKNHIDTHNTERAFECDQCNKKFKSKRRLYVHKFCHITEENFACDLCDGRFKTKQYLKFHMIKHSQIKPYECKVCNKRFKHKKSWDKHAGHDSGSTPVQILDEHECYYCEETFDTKTGMLEHVRSKHEETAEFDGQEEDEENTETNDNSSDATVYNLPNSIKEEASTGHMNPYYYHETIHHSISVPPINGVLIKSEKIN